jgi:hypothetical protein
VRSALGGVSAGFGQVSLGWWWSGHNHWRGLSA